MIDQEINEAVARKLRVQPRDVDFGSWPPDFCHSIEAAWEILLSLKCDWELKTTKYGIDIRIYDDAGVYPSVVDDTAPMAVCKAFLREDNESKEKI